MAKKLFIMSVGAVFVGMSTKPVKVQKHIRLCFVGTKAQVDAELESMRARQRFLERDSPKKRRETVEIYEASPPVKHKV